MRKCHKYNLNYDNRSILHTPKYNITCDCCGHPDQQQYLYCAYRKDNGQLMTVAYVSPAFITISLTQQMQVAGVTLHCFFPDDELIETIFIHIIDSYQHSNLEYIALDNNIIRFLPILEKLGFTMELLEDDATILALAPLS